IVHPVHLPLRLIYEDIDRLRDDAGDGAYGIADRGVLGNDEPGAEAARNFGIERRGGRTDGHQRIRQARLGIEESRDGPALHHAIDQDAERPPASIVRLDTRILCERTLQPPTRRLSYHEL